MKKSASQENKGLKTFFVFTGIVLFFILISLTVKAFFVIKESKFDGRHHFTITITKEAKIKKIIVFNPPQSKTTTVDLQGDGVEEQSLNQLLGFIPDATIDTDKNFEMDSDTPGLMRKFGLKYASIKTDLTLLDIIKLVIASHKTSNDQTQIAIQNNNYENKSSIKNLFIDDEISSEDITVQVINATGTSGMGRRLENVLVNLGCNVISVTTSQKTVKNSQIQYFGEKPYTLEKIGRLLKFDTVKIDKKQIADIVVIIGEDAKSSASF